MIIVSCILVYQTIYTYVVFFNKENEVFNLLLNLFHKQLLFPLILIGGIIFMSYIFLSTIFEWWLIWYIHKKNDKNATDISFLDSLGNGIYQFLPLFEFSNIFAQFRWINLLNFYLLCIRFIGIQYIHYLSIIFLVIGTIALVIQFLFIYTKYEIILANKKTFESLWTSLKISILNISITLKLFIFMIILNIRVILNFIIFFTIPIIITLFILYISSKIFLTIAITLTLFISLILLSFLWYISWVLEIFKTSLWYFAYKHGTQKLKEIENTQ